MIRFLLLSILLTFVVRSASVLWAGIVRGLQQQNGGGSRSGGSQVPKRGVQMVRDPVCGTFIVRDRALTLPGIDGDPVYFCGAACRDTYRSRPPAASSRTA
jgi:YHS domain-containing protein